MKNYSEALKILLYSQPNYNFGRRFPKHFFKKKLGLENVTGWASLLFHKTNKLRIPIPYTIIITHLVLFVLFFYYLKFAVILLCKYSILTEPQVHIIYYFIFIKKKM